MTSQFDGKENPRSPRRIQHLFLGAVLVTAGVFIYSAFDYSPDFLEGLSVNALLGIVAFPLIMLVVAALLYGIGRVLGRTRDLILPCLLLAILLAAYGWFTNRPIERFRNLVLDPPPRSLSELHVDCRTSFNDGRAWLFTFHIAPTDFPALITQLGLNPASIGTGQGKLPLQQMRDDFPDILAVPPNAQCFTAPRTILVTDPNHSLISLYLDRWRRPSATQSTAAQTPAFISKRPARTTSSACSLQRGTSTNTTPQ
jgi:hypothetical protein